MKDHKSTLVSTLPSLAAGLLRLRRPRQTGARVLLELRAGAGVIPLICLEEIEGIDRVDVPCHLQNSAVVSLIAKLIDARNVFEFGTYKGETAMLIAEHCRDCQVVTLDLPDGVDFETASATSEVEFTDVRLFRYDRQKGRATAIKGEPATRITQIQQESSTFDATPFAGRFDLIYVDASHSYSAVKNDTEKAFTMLKPGGVIIWDDYYYPGVWLYLNELARARPELDLGALREWKKVIMPGDRLKWTGPS
jgi:predicted O-methyltransferase YrrM